MANWYGTARSNYFRVKDLEAFKAAMSTFDDITVDEAPATHWPDLLGDMGPRDGKVCLLVDGDDGWPSSYFDEEACDDREVDMVTCIAPYLADDEICVLVQIGAEKLRYIDGWAVAFNHRGERQEVSLNDIYDKAKAAFGKTPDRAAY